MDSSQSTKSIFNKRAFCLVTGASKGLGRHIAFKLAEKLSKPSVFLLLARSREGLEETAKMIENNFGGLIRVKFMAMDLADQDDDSFKKIIQDCMDEMQVTCANFDLALVVHNAASMGDVSKNLVEMKEKDDIGYYWQLNLTSPVLLTTRFMKTFDQSKVENRMIVNISSICSLQPFKTWSLYCAGKAARDMLFSTLAQETPDIRVLNYAPGPIDTDMQLVARTQTGDPELRKLFLDMKKQSKLLTCDQSVTKLITLLDENTFESGAHIDYYDI